MLNFLLYSLFDYIQISSCLDLIDLFIFFAFCNIAFSILQLLLIPVNMNDSINFVLIP